MRQKVQCPYQDCNFETSVYTTFNANKSRDHDGRQMHSQLQFKPGTVTHTETFEVFQTENERDIQDTTDFQEEHLMADNIDDLELQLEHNLAALFHRMRTILNITVSAMQDVIQQMRQKIDLSKPFLFSAIQRILLNYYPDADTSIAREIVSPISDETLSERRFPIHFLQKSLLHLELWNLLNLLQVNISNHLC